MKKGIFDMSFGFMAGSVADLLFGILVMRTITGSKINQQVPEIQFSVVSTVTNQCQ